jgi:hypothetical protein
LYIAENQLMIFVYGYLFSKYPHLAILPNQ